MEVAKLFITLSADTSDVRRGMSDATSATQSAIQSIDQMSESMHRAQEATGGLYHTVMELVEAEAIVETLKEAFERATEIVTDAVKAFEELQAIQAQTEAGIKSTGGAAGVTAQQVGDLADALERHTGISGEAVQRGENLLLTFTNIQNRVGAGNDIFNRATQAMADLSVRMGGDTQAAAIQLGKALNDPVQGVTALQRVGVSFSDSQKSVISKLEETGHVLDAQKIVLKELETEFGGSAAAFGQTMAGAAGKVSGAWEDLGRAFVGQFEPQITGGLNDIASALRVVGDDVASDGIATGLYHAFGPGVSAAIASVGAILAGVTASALAPFATALVGTLTGTEALTVAQASLAAATTEASSAEAFMSSTLTAQAEAQAALEAAQARATEATAAAAAIQPTYTSGLAASAEAAAVAAAAQADLAAAEAALAAASDDVILAQASLTIAQQGVAAATAETTAATRGWAAAAGVAAGEALTAMAPVVIVATGVASVAYTIMKNWDGLRDDLIGIYADISTSAADWYNNTRAAVERAIDAFKSFGTWLGGFLSPIFSTIATGFSKMASVIPEQFKAPLEAAADSFRGFVVHAGSAVATLPATLAPFAKSAGDTLKSLAQTVNDNSILAPLEQGMTKAWATIQKYTGDSDVAFGGMAGAAQQSYTAMAAAADAGTSKAAKAAQKLADEIKKAFADIPAKLHAVDVTAAALGESLYKTDQEKVQVLEQGLKHLIELGVSPTDTHMRALIATMAALKTQMDQLKAGDDAMAAFAKHVQPLMDYQKSLDAIALKAKALGPSFDAVSAKIQLTSSTIEKMVTMPNPWDAQSNAVQNLDTKLQQLQIDKVGEDVSRQIQAINDKALLLGPTFDATAAKVQVYTNAEGQLATMHVTAGAAVDDYRQKLTDLQTPLQAYDTNTSLVRNDLGLLQNSVEEIGKSFGVSFTDPVSSAALAVLNVGQGISGLITSVPAVVAGLGGMAAFITGTLIPAEAAWFTATTAATGGLNLIAAGVVGAGAAILGFATNWNGMRDGVLGTLGSFANAFGGFFTFLGEGFHNAISYVTTFWDALHGDFHAPDIINTTAQALADVTTDIQDATKAAIELTGTTDELYQTLDKDWTSGLQSSLKNFLSGSGNLTADLRDGVKNAVLDGIIQATLQESVIKGYFGNLFQSLSSSLAGHDTVGASSIIGQIGALVPSVAAQITSLLGPLQSAMASAFPAAQSASGNTSSPVAAIAATTPASAASAGAVNTAYASLATSAYGNQISALQAHLQYLANGGGGGEGSQDWQDTLKKLQDAQSAMRAAQPHMADGGFFDRATSITIGEAGPEVAMPLRPDVYRQMAAGIVQAMPAPAPVAGQTINLTVNWQGSGTQDDADEMGEKLVNLLRMKGVKLA